MNRASVLALIFAATAGMAGYAQTPQRLPDLSISSVGFTNDGHMTFAITSLGAAITQPFRVEAHVDGVLRRTYDFAPTKSRSLEPTALPLNEGQKRTFIVQRIRVHPLQGKSRFPGDS